MQNIPLISGDDYNVILEDKSLQEFTDEISQDSLDLTNESTEVIESTIDVIASTEEIEAASEAGLLSGIALKAYSNRVNSYLDKLESKQIILKEDKLMSGLQFDNPHAGLLSVKETLKSAIRKVIEWAARVGAYMANAIELLYRKINDFIKSRAGVSKKLKERVKNISSDRIYVNTDVYNTVLKKNALLFSYSMADSISVLDIEGARASITRAEIAFDITKNKLDLTRFLETYAKVLQEFSVDKLPNVVTESNGDCKIVSNNSNIYGVEKYLIDTLYRKLSKDMTPQSFQGLWLPDQMVTGEDVKTSLSENEFNYSKTRMFLGKAQNLKASTLKEKFKPLNLAYFVLFSKKDLSIAAVSGIEFDFMGAEKSFLKHVEIDSKNVKPNVFKNDLEKLVKLLDDSSDSLKKMFSESSKKVSTLNKYISKNIDELKKDGLKEGGKDSDIFNPELRLKLKVILQQSTLFPTFISSQIGTLSSLIDDGVKLLQASLGESADKEKVSTTPSSSEEKPVILLLAAPEKREEEIIDVEVL